MNLKGILLVTLLALSGAAVGISQVVAGEAVRIRIKGLPAEDKAKIDADYPVSKEGTVNLPFIGQINAAGKSLEQLARDIEKAYINAQIFIEPEIEARIPEIHIPDANANRIHVGGLVGKPGPIRFAAGMTLWKAIQAAGGATEFGSLKRVKLYRDGKQTAYDMTKEEHHSVLLKVNDTIEVPQISGCADH